MRETKRAAIAWTKFGVFMFLADLSEAVVGF